jgi:Xaa-Pro aminopeptidase
MNHPFRSRIKAAISLLNESKTNQALVISSNPTAHRSADQCYPYRGNSDLFYFTGICAPDTTLVIRNYSKPAAVLIIPPVDPIRKVWEGAPVDPRPLAKSAGVAVSVSKRHTQTVLELLAGADHAYTQAIRGTTSSVVRQDLSNRSVDQLGKLPATFSELEKFTAHLRLYKEPSEIEAIVRAAYVTGDALQSAFPYIKPGATERDIGAFIDYYYRCAGGEPAFGTIVAAGRSAATLHYHTLSRTIRRGELVLIDTGVELDMYAADITRTIPVGGVISPVLRTLYEAVLSAQRAAISKVKDGVLIKEVYTAAATELTIGLKEVGVLKGPTSALMKKEAFKPYFPHGIGHSLGIDVHDVGSLRGNQGARLKAGMVFTVEPGLYFSKGVGKVAPCGIRIEDDVLVTKAGSAVLTESAFPKELAELLAQTE